MREFFFGHGDAWGILGWHVAIFLALYMGYHIATLIHRDPFKP